MSVIYTILAAVSCMTLVILVDIGITKMFSETCILQKKYVKMALSYFTGIFVFLFIVKILFS